MTTMFRSMEQAIATVASMANVDPDSFEEVPGLKVCGFYTLLLDSSETSDELKGSIRDRIESQKGYKFTKDGKEIKIVIGPFLVGYECWVVGENGYAMRL